jgi:hypothetical protein
LITATVKGFQKFSVINEDIERLSLAALDEAAAVAAEAAQANASIDLEIEVVPATVGVEAVTSGIISRKQGRTSEVRIAPFFDRGTLAGHQGALKRPGHGSWSVRRKGSTYQAQRHPVTDGEGIKAERFFSRARSAGRRALLARVERGAAAVSFFGR